MWGATVAGRVIDGRTGRIVPATVAIHTSDGKIIADHPAYKGGFRSDGTFEKEIPAGETTIIVSRGFDYIPVRRRVVVSEGEHRSERFVLYRRSPLLVEGWYASDHHVHMIHGERKTLVDFAYAALAARAEALDFTSVAQFWPVPKVTPEVLDEAVSSVSTPDFKLAWNVEEPKNYFRGDVAACLGHGWTVGMRGRTRDGRDAIAELLEMSAHDYESDKEPFPNFESHELIHSLGGIVSYSHPARWGLGKWGGRGIYPAEENKFISNMAQELPFDTLVGPTYDSLDVLMPPQEKQANAEALKLWFMLLNRGYHIAGSASSDATFDNPGRGLPGRVRIYTRVGGKPDLAKVAAAIKSGHSFMTSGPLMVFEIGGRGSGDVITLPARAQRARIRAWADRLTRIEIFRNGTLVRTLNVPNGKPEFTAEFDVDETGERAWYVARCYGADDMQVAITNPVWFEPRGWKPPQPVRALVSGTIVDAETGKPLDGSVETIHMVGKAAVIDSRSQSAAGKFKVAASGTARVRVQIPGYRPLTRSIFMDYAPLIEGATKMRPGQLTTWSTFENISEQLGKVSLEFRMERAQ